MDRIVIDSGVGVKWFTVGPDAKQARSILDSYRAESLNLLAPDFILLEVANVMWKLQRFGGLNPQLAKSALEDFLDIELTLTSTDELLSDAYDLAVQHERSVYDPLYLALSLREECPLVTADEKLYNAVGAKFPNLIMLANWSQEARGTAGAIVMISPERDPQVIRGLVRKADRTRGHALVTMLAQQARLLGRLNGESPLAERGE